MGGSGQTAAVSEPFFTPDESAGLTLQSLMVDVGDGQETSFEAAYPRLASVAFGVAVKVLGDHAQAEEVAQDVLLEVWVTADRFNPERGAAQPWVATIAHRRAVDRVRSVQATRRRDTLWAADVLVHEPSPDEAEARLDAQQVRTALARLTTLQRQAIQLAYYHGLTYQEVADRLDVPLATVKSRIRDGLLRLRVCLDLGSGDQMAQTC